MDKLIIITNNVPRQLIYGYELPEKVKADFEYIDDEEFAYHNFVMYQGNYYDVSEFTRIAHNAEFKGWDGYHGDSFFSGILVKFIDSDTVLMGRYYS